MKVMLKSAKTMHTGVLPMTLTMDVLRTQVQQAMTKGGVCVGNAETGDASSHFL